MPKNKNNTLVIATPVASSDMPLAHVHDSTQQIATQATMVHRKTPQASVVGSEKTTKHVTKAKQFLNILKDAQHLLDHSIFPQDPVKAKPITPTIGDNRPRTGSVGGRYQRDRSPT